MEAVEWAIGAMAKLEGFQLELWCSKLYGRVDRHWNSPLSPLGARPISHVCILRKPAAYFAGAGYLHQVPNGRHQKVTHTQLIGRRSRDFICTSPTAYSPIQKQKGRVQEISRFTFLLLFTVNTNIPPDDLRHRSCQTSVLKFVLYEASSDFVMVDADARCAPAAWREPTKPSSCSGNGKLQLPWLKLLASRCFNSR